MWIKKEQIDIQVLFFVVTLYTLDSTVYKYTSNRLSSTKGGNREMNKLYKMSQVSNITRKTKFSHIA